MRKMFAAVALLGLAGLTLSGCHDGRPGHDSDRYGHHRHHDRGHHYGGHY